MNTLTRLLVGFSLALVLLVAPVLRAAGVDVYASAIHNTTLSAAITSTTTTIAVTTCTGITGSSFGNCAVGWFGYVDQEQFRVTAVSSNTLTVTRNIGGSQPAPHANAARVFLGPSTAPSWKKTDPPLTQGANADCTQQPLPWLNMSNGNVWVCRGGTAGTWSVTNALPVTFNSVSPGLPF